MDNSIPFFRPVFCDEYIYLKEKTYLDVATQFVDSYFYLGGKKAVVIGKDANTDKIAVVEIDGKNSVNCIKNSIHYIATAIKIITYATLIIPILMLVAKVILRSQNTYEILNDKLTLPGFDERKKYELDSIKTNGSCRVSLFVSGIKVFGPYYARYLSECDPFLRNDKDFVLAFVARRGMGRDLEFAPDHFKKDREVVLAAVGQNGMALEFAHESLRNDDEIVRKALEVDPRALQFAHKRFKNDKPLLLDLLKSRKDGSEFLKTYILEFMDPSLRKDPDFMLEALKLNIFYLNYADPALLDKLDFILKAVKEDGAAFAWAPEKFKKNPQVVLTATQVNESALPFADGSVIKCGFFEGLYDVKYNKKQGGLIYTTNSKSNVKYKDVLYFFDLLMTNPKILSLKIDSRRYSSSGLRYPENVVDKTYDIKSLMEKLVKPEVVFGHISKTYSNTANYYLLKEIKKSLPKEYEKIVQEIAKMKSNSPAQYENLPDVYKEAEESDKTERLRQKMTYENGRLTNLNFNFV